MCYEHSHKYEIIRTISIANVRKIDEVAVERLKLNFRNYTVKCGQEGLYLLLKRHPRNWRQRKQRVLFMSYCFSFTLKLSITPDETWRCCS